MRHPLFLTSAAMGLALALSGVASAAPTSPPVTSSPIYDTNNGATTFPGTNVGTIGFGGVNQIGDLALFNGGSGGAFVSAATNPSIYAFYYAGGDLLIQEQIGNNGYGNAIDVELDSLSSSTASSASSILASITIPFSSGPSLSYTIYDGYLAAGYYAIDSYLAANNLTDPNYQINFTVPEPAAAAVLSVGLIGLGCVSRRRRSVA